MLTNKTAVFLINLVQDVNIVRPLVFMATRDFGLDALLLVSTKFAGRDLFGIWQEELDGICEQTGARLEFFGDDWEAHRTLTGEGLIFAASESHLQNHVTTHSVFLHAPPGYLRVTLQHGFECVGFRHSADHVRAHGETASFGADIICSWHGPDQLTSIAASQRAKLLVTGPTAVLQMRLEPVRRGDTSTGIVCENLHSVRLNGAGDFKNEFVDAFAQFCRELDDDGSKVVLRPHPGGQYVLKNDVPLPKNARINNAPMYRLDMRQFAYGISAPSSVLIDMLLAQIPTAVWRDRDGGIDADNYGGLITVSTPREWIEFARSAVQQPEPILRLQEDFLRRSGMPLAPQEVFTRYAELFRTAQRMAIRPAGFEPEQERILFVANGVVPTLEVSFERPLASLVGRGAFTTVLLTEERLRKWLDGSDTKAEVNRILEEYDPSIIIFCRYSGPASEHIIDWARRERVPVIYHIDDDLLTIPPDIGARKFTMHNAPERIAAVRHLLTSADLVYASTAKLRSRLLDLLPELQVVAGRIYCAGSVQRRPQLRPVRKLGYMASADHAHNLDMILPAIERLLDRNPTVGFELFGSIPIPAALHRFGDRIQTAPPVSHYERFMNEFAEREWDIGICPLAPIEFNMMKANTKWVEYTSVGAAVVASRGTVYDECCGDGCGLLAHGVDEWFEALDYLINDDAARMAIVERAQAKLYHDYNIGRLRDQVLDVIARAHEAAGNRKTNPSTGAMLACQTA
jgi:glycosyltransferase involved in cell wall biosynthesis